MPEFTAGQLFRRWFDEVWNQRDRAKVVAYIHPDGLIHGMDETGAPSRGPDEFLQFHAKILEAFPDIHFTIHEVVEQGDMAAGRWTATMTHCGDGLGVPPTGACASISGMAILRAEGGQMVESWNEWDRLGLMQACRLVAPTA